ncbi:MAG TPA: PLP-dependent aminotransferase family protein [Kofleriaceae bacterium]
MRIDSVLVRVDRDGPGSLQRQIATGLREAIASGLVAARTRLPGTRTLAAQLGVSRTTAALAIDALIAEGYVVARPRSGCFVADDPPRAARPLRTRQAATPRATVRPSRAARARARDAAASPPDRRSRTAFPLSRPALDAFPIETWSRLLSRRAARTSIAQLDYGGGLPVLARAIATLVSASRGVRIEPAQVLIVGGGQRAIEVAAAAILDPGDRVVVEDPGYPGAREAFLAAGAELLPVRVDRDGLDVAALPRRARLAYVTPACQFPLAVPLSLARRTALLRWATRAGAVIVEDDYDAEFRFAGAPLPSLAALDRDGRVLQAGSFSRTLFPAIRLGYLIVPPALVEAVRAVRDARDPDMPSLPQLALADFIEAGHYVHHLRRMRVLYRARRDVLIAAARAAGLTVRLGEVGLHIVCDLPPGCDARTVSSTAAAAGITAAPLAAFQLRGRAPQAIVLGFGSVPPARIRSAMALLAEVALPPPLLRGRPLPG